CTELSPGPTMMPISCFSQLDMVMPSFSVVCQSQPSNQVSRLPWMVSTLVVSGSSVGSSSVVSSHSSAGSSLASSAGSSAASSVGSSVASGVSSSAGSSLASTSSDRKSVVQGETAHQASDW